MESVTLKAQERDLQLTGRQLRRSGLIPAVIYNHGNTEHLVIDGKDIKPIISGGISESRLLDIERGDKKDTVFIKDYQVHPLTNEIIHFDFYRITYGEKVKTHIPIHLEGKSQGEKEGGVLEIFMHDVELEILPKELIPQITLDIGALKLGDAIHVDDVTLPPSAKILVEGNPVICHVSIPRKVAASADGSEDEGAAKEDEADKKE